MLILPTERSIPKVNNPKFLILFGRPKAGKSTIVASLDNNLIIDLENGYMSLSALVVQARSINDFAEIANALKAKQKELGHYPYKYITIDNATRLEEMCLPYAAQLYKLTPQGKSWQGTDVRLLPQGGGYLYLREAVKKVIYMFRDLCDSLILVAHVKEKMINKEGEELSEMSIDLAGKLGDILCGEADAIGYVYRKKNETHISFEGGDNTIREARAEHLRGKNIVVATSDENNHVTVDMTKIFLPE